MDRNWKLGDDLVAKDEILEGITFEELIETIQSNCEEITPLAVEQTLNEIVNFRMKEMMFLLERNVLEIIKMSEVSDSYRFDKEEFE